MTSTTFGLSKSIQQELQQTALALAAVGKGILAADESLSTIGKKFLHISLENNKENRRLYRQMLFSNEQIADYISGIIMHEETAYQKNDQGITFLEHLRNKSIIPGIKVDKGVTILLGTNGETATQGLDDLRTRCEEYYRIGFRFAKWRAVFKIGEHEPSTLAINENAHGLARYAAICQECRLVPIVEPDVLQDGKHSIDLCQQVCEKVLAAIFKALNDYNVVLEGILLKPNMIMSGYDCPDRSNPDQIAVATVNTLFRTVPPAVPAIMFLSGGQSEEEATVHLNSINKFINQFKPYKPWHLSFSFGRALQNSAIVTWAGKTENVQQAQYELIKRIKANSLASQGKYIATFSISSSDAATKSNFMPKHVY